MVKNTFDLIILLKIETDENLDYISDILNLSPTDSIKKGERKLKFSDEAESNIWMYDKKFRDCENIGNKLCGFLESIPQLSQKIDDVKKIGTITMRISLISDLAQIGITLSEKDLALLSDLQIPLEISVFSWGGCVDE